MSEYIKKEDALKPYQEESTQIWMDDVYKHLIGLPTYSFPEREKGEWIPVSERLPEATEYVLVTDELGVFVAWYSPEKARFKGWYSFRNIPVKRPILAWQPLPEPYKAESEE